MKKLLIAMVAIALVAPAAAHAKKSREPKIADSTPRQFTSTVALPGVGAAEVTIVSLQADEARANSSISSALSDASSKAGTYTSEARSINEQPAKSPVVISVGMADVLNKCRDYSSLTKGAFDITGNGSWKNISAKIAADGATATRKSETAQIDSSLFALALKGILADDIIAKLSSEGWGNAQVVIGSIQRNIGKNIHTPWSVRIDAPTAAERGKFAFRAYDYSIGDVATAKMSPALYPAAANPEGEPQVVATVVFANDAITAVTYAVATYVNSVKDAAKGMAFIRSRPEVRGIVVAQDGTMHSSDELAIHRPEPFAAPPSEE